jgi:hypothetical protein
MAATVTRRMGLASSVIRDNNFLTTAVWESEKAFENAIRAVAIEFQKQGFNREEATKTLKTESVRSTYERSPY